MNKLTLKEFLVCDAMLGDASKVIEKSQINDTSIDIDKEFDKFFKFNTNDRSIVTSVSCKLFAKHIVDLIREKNNTQK